MSTEPDFDVVVVGGGPSGATAAHDLTMQGHKVMLLDKAGRIKPCGGAVPPRLLKDFDIPESLLVAHAKSARIIAPSNTKVNMPCGDGYVGMVDRDQFDEWLRTRASEAGATRVTGKCEDVLDRPDGLATVAYRTDRNAKLTTVTARCVIGADGARSRVAQQCIPNGENVKCVFAYHEIVKVPEDNTADYEPDRCDVYYQGHLSPDFYAWVFPHGKTASIGLGSANKGFPLRETTKLMREQTGFSKWETIRKEGAPIPLKPLKRWDNGRNVLVAGDAAGVVAPSSGEGIYYAMYAGRMSADAVNQFLVTGNAKALRGARKAFMKAHGRVFWILGVMQYFWYSSDKRRERFVKMCDDPDVQRLTWEAYMNKELVRRDPMAHIRIFIKDTAHLLGLRPAKA
ncbi:geranylgeranyl diphosphate reductase [Pontixanthobacter aestiaquae]|uniref:geranylgeranyl diphosphate reductase n=1 Tax=Pontixanthobacter aestiaquae TaxID=1509367 RepID=A0A844Z8S5_9SPHN|nr:geranylgeranyl diphosphate reductase [Pontixanthobacter aestiaquae]MDN3644775.1 geranylgeranyl diphosphate reductase [Pontixanthobacter aestiaquae]MXO84218.1 geranylgeranyl diphosphate reductase [Pontixanthobacter aestiaquae]